MTILDIIGERVPLKPSGTSYKGLCPFHTEKTPSFHVNPDRGFFHCFGCGTGGDVVQFVELMDGVTFSQAVRSLAPRYEIAVPTTREEEIACWAAMTTHDPPPPPVETRDSWWTRLWEGWS